MFRTLAVFIAGSLVVVTQLAAADPVFGPALVRLADGSTQSHPLSSPNYRAVHLGDSCTGGIS